MRVRWLAILGMLVAVALTGCNSSPFSVTTAMGNTVQGSGKVISQDRQVSGFSLVSLAGTGDLQIAQTGAESLRIDAEDNVMPLIITTVVNGKLTIAYEPSSNINLTQPVVFHLTVKSLSELDLSGAANATIGALTGDKFTAKLEGAGSVTCSALTVTATSVTLTGAAKATLAGASTSQTVILSGAATYDAANFATTNTTVNISGAGNAVVAASSTLNVDVSGAGSVEYIGSPKLTQQITGAGTVRKRESTPTPASTP